MRYPSSLLAALLITSAASIALAQDRPPPRHHGPPAEALEACEGRSSGDACSFSHRDRTLEGECRAPEGRPLACVPEGHGPGHHHGPPPESIEACEGIEEGDLCAVDTPDGTREGTCVDGPRGLACLPHRPTH